MMNNQLSQIKRLNKLFAAFNRELADYDASKDMEVSIDVLKEEKKLVREIKAMVDWVLERKMDNE